MTDIRKPDVITVLIHRVDGGVTILKVVTTEYRPSTSKEKSAGLGDRVVNWSIEPTTDYINSIIAKHNWPPEFQAVSWEIVPNDFLPEKPDRSFRNAWKKNGKNIEVDMPKAREIHRNNLRKMRAPLLEKLDIEYQKADEQDDRDTKFKIARRKQALRDVTLDAAIDAAQTPDELKKVIPDVLKE